jgi:transposase InsO family protein
VNSAWQRAPSLQGEELHYTLLDHSPGKPVQNAYVESFNGRLRDEFLNANWFTKLSDARLKIETWRQDWMTGKPEVDLSRV